jgi:hypothetical protein
VTAIGRRSLGISHPKLKEVLHQDFADCSALTDALAGQDATVFPNMRWREFITLLGGATVVWPIAARAQHTDKLPRIGYLSDSKISGSTKARPAYAALLAASAMH